MELEHFWFWNCCPLSGLFFNRMWGRTDETWCAGPLTRCCWCLFRFFLSVCLTKRSRALQGGTEKITGISYSLHSLLRDVNTQTHAGASSPYHVRGGLYACRPKQQREAASNLRSYLYCPRSWGRAFGAACNWTHRVGAHSSPPEWLLYLVILANKLVRTFL